MTQTTSSTVSSPSPGTRRSTRHEAKPSSRVDRTRTRRKHSSFEERRELGHYTDVTDCVREVITVQGLEGSVLVVDRDALTLGDRRLVAHLAADEPAQNAALVCSCYLKDPERGRCRRVTAEDLTMAPFAEDEPAELPAAGSPHGVELLDRRRGDRWDPDCAFNYAYCLEVVRTGTSVSVLRWLRRSRGGEEDAPMKPVRLREVIAATESYEPACGLTLAGLALYREDPEVSVTVLRNELERVQLSPIVLNRKLRQMVLASGEQHGVSLSEIAIRCGRIKRDSKGNLSGETSWLARRIGILPDSGTGRPTPWVHSDVLGLIAREGLGISPREVEL